MEKPLYFAYGSNINLDQMRYAAVLQVPQRVFMFLI